MRYSTFLFLTLFICPAIVCLAQDAAFVIEGQVIDETTHSALPFCNVLNLTNESGTISNQEGYFKLHHCHAGDSIVVSFVGYDDQMVIVPELNRTLQIRLSEKGNLLSAALVTPKNQEFMFNLIEKCRKNKLKTNLNAKAYYELKSTIDDEQVEMVEAFYNAQTKDYDILNLDIKSGRLALKKFGNRLFASVENARVIIMHQMLSSSGFFPKNPLELSKSKNKQLFDLTLNRKFQNQDKDSIFVVSFTPKHFKRPLFSGEMWLNSTRSTIVKQDLKCLDCGKHPFISLFDTDIISQVDLNISKTYKEVGDKVVLEFINFSNSYIYQSRRDYHMRQSYKIHSEALLYLFDYDKSFSLPYLNLPKHQVTDYEKINSMPYNSFFWEFNDEYKLTDNTGLNDKFFSSESTITNQTFFEKGVTKDQSRFYESPFRDWNGNRLMIAQMTPDTNTVELSRTSFKSDFYNLEVDVFMDVNYYSDSLHVLSSTVVNPLKSFFHLPIDSYATCCFNMYFDIVEIERRSFMVEIQDLKDQGEIKRKHALLIDRISKLKQTYFSEVVRGTNRIHMEKWNTYIMTHLDIDNISIFGLYAEVSE